LLFYVVKFGSALVMTLIKIYGLSFDSWSRPLLSNFSL